MRAFLRLSCAVLVGAAVSLPASLILAREDGRDPTFCLETCRSIKIACDTACYKTCFKLYPDNYENRFNCDRACLKSCVDQQRNCIDQCRIDRPPTSRKDP